MHLCCLSNCIGTGRRSRCRFEGAGSTLQLGTAPVLDLVGPGHAPAKKGSTCARTLAAVPNQVLAVTFARTQAQMCS